MSEQTKMPESLDAQVPPTQPAPKPLPNIFIATPCYGGQIHLGYVTGLIAFVRDAQIQGIDVVYWLQGGESHINRARNYAVAAFLESKCSHLFFIDADISWKTTDIAKVISAAHNNDLDVVAGAYPIKEIDWAKAAKSIERGEDPRVESSRMVVHRLDIEHDSKGHVDGIGDCISVKECGTGFMCISRRAIEQMIAAHPEQRYTTDSTPVRVVYDLFHAGIRPDIFQGEPIQRWLSEDYWFCRWWRELGGTVWLHLGVDLGHWGTYEHRGNPHEVHGGPKKGLIAPPDALERVKATLQGSMMPMSSDANTVRMPLADPRLIVDHEAKEGSFAVWASTRYPDCVFDLFEADPVMRDMLRQNFAIYGLKGRIREPGELGVSFQEPFWRVRDGKVEVVT